MRHDSLVYTRHDSSDIWVMSPVWLVSHVWVMSHVYEWVIYVRHDSCLYVRRDSHMGHDSCVHDVRRDVCMQYGATWRRIGWRCYVWLQRCETWLIHIYETWLVHIWYETWRMHTTRRNMVENRSAMLRVTDTVGLAWDVTHLYIWDMTRSYMRHDSSIHETRLMCLAWDVTHSYICDMIRSCMRWDVTLHTTLLDMVEWHDSMLYETWLVVIWDVTRCYMRHDSLIYETWLVVIWDVTCAYMGRG